MLSLSLTASSLFLFLCLSLFSSESHINIKAEFSHAMFDAVFLARAKSGSKTKEKYSSVNVRFILLQSYGVCDLFK